MERKGLFKLPFQILLYEIPKYLELTDYINYTSTCKFLYNNMEKSDIWKSELEENYTKEETLFAQDKDSAYDKFKKLKIFTQNYRQCNVAHRETCWTEKKNELHLKNVCWLHIIGKFSNVPDGRYVPEFKVKIARRPLGLSRLTFNASVVEVPINTHEENDDDIQQDIPSQDRNGTEPTERADDSTEEANNNTNNNAPSLFSVALSVLTLGIVRINDARNNENNENNDNNNQNNDEIPSRKIMTSQNKFTNEILNIYRNDEWRIVEAPEIIVNHSLIDNKKSKIVVELEIKDINGYWKNGLNFKGMRLRKVEPTDSDSDVDVGVEESEESDVFE